jgi:hypothetical protein
MILKKKILFIFAKAMLLQNAMAEILNFEINIENITYSMC